MHAVDPLSFWAAVTPARPAIVQSDMVVTYEGLADAITSVGSRIAELELNRNEPVAVCIDNQAKQLCVSLACLHYGFSIAPVTRSDVIFLKTAGFNTLIYEAQGFALSGGRNIRFEDSWLRRPQRSTSQDTASRSDTNNSVIFFVPSVTAAPKKVVRSWADQLARLQTMRLIDNIECSTILLMSGWRGALRFERAYDALCRGSTLCLSGSAEMAASFAAMFHVDLIVASPPQAAALVAFAENNRGYEFPALRAIRIAEGRVSRKLATRIQSTLCKNIWIEYGSSEVGTMALAPYNAIRNVPGAAGITAPWADIEIVDKGGIAVPVGQEGIVRCRFAPVGLAVDEGDPSSDSSKAWWYPGDHGRLDARGVLCITGRDDDLIDRGEGNISARALDKIVGSFAGLRDAGVCGLTDQDCLDELWVAVVLEKKGVDLAALKRQIDTGGRLPTQIDQLFELTEIPRNQLGEINRDDLREKLLALKAQTTPPLLAH